MKRIKYPYMAVLSETKVISGQTVTENVEKIAYAFLRDTEENRARAVELSCTGEYTIEYDGQPEPEPTEQEQLRADVDFLLAMGGVL